MHSLKSALSNQYNFGKIALIASEEELRLWKISLLFQLKCEVSDGNLEEESLGVLVWRIHRISRHEPVGADIAPVRRTPWCSQHCRNNAMVRNYFR